MNPPKSSVQFHWTLLIMSAAILVLAVVLRNPDNEHVTMPLFGLALPELCTWRRILGVSCPGCGLTRAFIALAHGDVWRAWRFNPAALPLFAAVVFQLPYRCGQIVRVRRGNPEWRSMLIDLAGWCLVGLLLVQWVVRLL